MQGLLLPMQRVQVIRCHVNQEANWTPGEKQDFKSRSIRYWSHRKRAWSPGADFRRTSTVHVLLLDVSLPACRAWDLRSGPHSDALQSEHVAQQQPILHSVLPVLHTTVSRCSPAALIQSRIPTLCFKIFFIHYGITVVSSTTLDFLVYSRSWLVC